MWHIVLFLTLLVVCTSYALIRGGAPERVAAVIVLAGVLGTGLVSSSYLGRFSSVEIRIAAVDALMTMALIILALKANRYWPMWMAATVAFGLVAHLAQVVAPDIMPKVYATAHAFSSYPTLLVLAVGTFRHRRRMGTFGSDRAWSGRSPSGVSSN
jgi:cytochrome bd-type quinol oxidase subunit 2